MTTEDQYRQGDLLFKRVSKLPTGLSRWKDNIILRGEATGHAHVLQNGQIFHRYGYLQRLTPQTEIYIEVENNGRVVHEEHAMLELPLGIYQVIRQREFSPWGITGVHD